ncbi:unnamed protein product [Amoebophrya sp. A120]|nr:unnamed protein product [Amoebophrya sp. A120]|eukprot:GSA120T00021402001.1
MLKKATIVATAVPLGGFGVVSGAMTNKKEPTPTHFWVGRETAPSGFMEQQRVDQGSGRTHRLFWEADYGECVVNCEASYPKAKYDGRAAAYCDTCCTSKNEQSTFCATQQPSQQVACVDTCMDGFVVKDQPDATSYCTNMCFSK